MEIKHKVLHVRVNLAESAKRRNVSSSDCKLKTSAKKPSHKTTLSLNIPSGSSPRMQRIKKNIRCPVVPANQDVSVGFKLVQNQAGFKNQFNVTIKTCLNTSKALPSNKENEKPSNPKEIPSNLLKTSRRLTLNSILLTTHSNQSLLTSLKHF